MFADRRERASAGMRREGPLEDPLDDLLEDLERQAEGLHLADRAVEVAELRVAQYAEIELIARLHASAGRRVRVGTTDGWDVQGHLVRAGADWIVLADGFGRGWALTLQSVATIGGLADSTVPAAARPISARLPLRVILRRAAEAPEPVAVRVAGGRILHGRLARVGADFVELVLETGETTAVRLAALVAVQLTSGGAA
jgi:hypothetical protein